MEALRTLVGTFHERESIEVAYKSFGRSEMGVVEVSIEHLPRAALWLRSEETLRFDWLELMSCYEKKGRLHLSYFIRSQSRNESCVLRTSVEPHGQRAWAVVPSLCGIWPMLAPYEEELSRLFGITFHTGELKDGTRTPGDFPLRKTFKWMEEQS